TTPKAYTAIGTVQPLPGPCGCATSGTRPLASLQPILSRIHLPGGKRMATLKTGPPFVRRKLCPPRRVHWTNWTSAMPHKRWARREPPARPRYPSIETIPIRQTRWRSRNLERQDSALRLCSLRYSKVASESQRLNLVPRIGVEPRQATVTDGG